MKLNHLNVTVTNVPEAHKFLQKYFGMRDMGGTTTSPSYRTTTEWCSRSRA
jgi:hypothetical protein